MSGRIVTSTVFTTNRTQAVRLPKAVEGTDWMMRNIVSTLAPSVR